MSSAVSPMGDGIKPSSSIWRRTSPRAAAASVASTTTMFS
jgi:hypothetical protein